MPRQHFPGSFSFSLLSGWAHAKHRPPPSIYNHRFAESVLFYCSAHSKPVREGKVGETPHSWKLCWPLLCFSLSRKPQEKDIMPPGFESTKQIQQLGLRSDCSTDDGCSLSNLKSSLCKKYLLSTSPNTSGSRRCTRLPKKNLGR